MWKTISSEEQHDVPLKIGPWIHGGAKSRTGGTLPEAEKAVQDTIKCREVL
jgi:hypothetical protein